MGAAKPRMGAAEVRMGAAEIGHAAVLLLRLEQDPLEGAAVDVEPQGEVGAIVVPNTMSDSNSKSLAMSPVEAVLSSLVGLPAPVHKEQGRLHQRLVLPLMTVAVDHGQLSAIRVECLLEEALRA